MTGTTIETCIRIMSRWGKDDIVRTEKEGFVVARQAQPRGHRGGVAHDKGRHRYLRRNSVTEISWVGKPCDLILDRPDRSKIRVDRAEVLVRHPRKHRPRHDGIEASVLRGKPLCSRRSRVTKTCDEKVAGPISNAGVGIWSDVGGLDAARQRNVEGGSAGVFHALDRLAAFGAGVTHGTARYRGQIPAVGDGTAAIRRRLGRIRFWKRSDQQVHGEIELGRGDLTGDRCERPDVRDDGLGVGFRERDSLDMA